MGAEIKITTKALLGYILLTVGLVFLIYVTINVLLLGTGIIQPMKFYFDESVVNQVLFGLVVQFGSFVVLTAVAAIFMANGVSLVRG
jgi:hypothetical protein